MPQLRSVLLHLRQHQLAFWSSRRKCCRTGLPQWLFPLPSRATWDRKREGLWELFFCKDTASLQTSPWRCRCLRRCRALTLCTRGWNWCEAPPAFARPGGGTWGSAVLLAPPGWLAAGPSTGVCSFLLAPTPHCLLTATCEHGALPQWKLLPRPLGPAQPIPAEVPRSRGAGPCCCRAPRRCRGAEQPFARGSLVWHRLWSGMLPKPVTPAPLSSSPHAQLARTLGGLQADTGGDRPCGAATAPSWVLAKKECHVAPCCTWFGTSHCRRLLTLQG